MSKSCKCPGFQGSVSRREFLFRVGGGLGGMALASLLDKDGLLANADVWQGRGGSRTAPTSPLAPKQPHFPAKAKSVIMLYMAGAVSHIDTFDYKPEIERQNGKLMEGKGKLDLFFGQPGTLMKSPWEFKPRGKSGKMVSDLLPHLAECVDDITFIHSMAAKSSSHGPAMFQMNTGFTQAGFPSVGSWITYGLGSESQNLPAFVVLPDSRGFPPSGPANWGAGFLPAIYQGTAFRPKGDPILDLFPNSPNGDVNPESDKAARELLAKMNRAHLEQNDGDSELSARINAYELAARMQLSAPEVTDLSGESEATKKLYGLDDNMTAGTGRNCLLARRLVERGVRFVLVFAGAYNTGPRINWDAHEDIFLNHTEEAKRMDQPVAALLKDLKSRGMLDETLVVSTTEFGRMAISQGKGRDHNQHAFTAWMAGGGIKAGFSYGVSDEFGYKIVENPCTVYDFHATILHLLGIDHTKLTYYYNGRHYRLTDVHGSVISDLSA